MYLQFVRDKKFVKQDAGIISAAVSSARKSVLRNEPHRVNVVILRILACLVSV